MIPANLSLVPLSHERCAVMQAIAEVEKKHERGACCWLLLSVSEGCIFFPETKFKTSDRCRCQSELSAERYIRQRRREAYQRQIAYQALAGQAEIELAFHTPETVSSWSARWSCTELQQYDLENMFCRWSERFPSLEPMEHWMMANQPFLMSSRKKARTINIFVSNEVKFK